MPRPRDLLIFDAIRKHGPLPSHYLYQFTKEVAKDRTELIKRLQSLWLQRYLDRPLTLNPPLVLNDHLTYTLGERLNGNTYATPPSGGFAHALMTSITTANIELGCKEAGIRFISQEEILAKASDKTRTAKRPLAIPTRISYTYEGKTLRSDTPTEPDQLFGIDYGDDGAFFFAVEADRGNEPITRRCIGQNSILKKLLAYTNILRTGEGKRRFGIPNLLPMFITTSEDRVHHMVELLKAIDPSPSFLFKAIPGFHPYFRTPPLLPDIFVGEWMRVNKPFFLNLK